jgi:hypothetical protein
MNMTRTEDVFQNGDATILSREAKLASDIEGNLDLPTIEGPSGEDDSTEEWTTLKFTHGGRELCLSVEKSDRHVHLLLLQSRVAYCLPEYST